MLKLLFHVALDHMHSHMARPFYHYLYIVFPSDFGELAQGIELSKLCLIVSIGDGAWAHAITQR